MMTKRLGFTGTILLVCMMLVFSAAAQQTPPVFAPDGAIGYVPADAIGMIALSADETDAALTQLRYLHFVGQLLQPPRIDFAQLPLEQYIPLDVLDAEGVTFADQIDGWLAGDIVIAYGAFAQGLQTTPDHTMLILPTDDSLAATAALSLIVRGQQNLNITDYRGVRVYEGDLATLAITPRVVLIGGRTLIERGIDIVLGDGARLIDTDGYQRVRAALPDYTLFAYVAGDAASDAIPFAVSRDPVRSGAILSAIGGAIRAVRPNSELEASLLTGGVDAIGVSLQVELFDQFAPTRVNAAAAFDLRDPIPQRAAGAAFDPALLNAVPRSAFLVTTGADARAAALDALAALPAFNTWGVALDAFAIDRAPGVINESFPLPTDADLQAALANTFAVLNERGIDVRADLLDQLDGSFAFALIGRRNNPVPILNTPYEALLVAQIDDGAALIDGASRLGDALFGARLFTEVTLENAPYLTLDAPTGERVLTIGAVDDVLFIGTGDAVASARRAVSGDNRLIDEPRWSAASIDGSPDFYLDFFGFYSTFVPNLLGDSATAAADQVGIDAALIDADLYVLTMRVELPE